VKSNVSYISTRGRIVIPAAIREGMGLTPGTRVTIERAGDTIVLRPLTRDFIRSLRGSFRGLGLEEFRDREHRKDKR